nr:FHA domain-containing protein [Calditrichia bacterium]
FDRDNTVSRQHARLFCLEDRFYIEDLGSKNYTFLNEEPVQRARLQNGDVIRIGQNSLTFHKKNADKTEDSSALTTVHENSDTTNHTIDFNYLVMQRLSDLLKNSAGLEPFLKGTLALATEALQASYGAVLVFEQTGQPFQVVSKGSGTEYLQSIVNHTMESGRGQIADREYGELKNDRGCILCVPLENKPFPRGVIYLEHDGGPRFHRKDLKLLSDIAGQIGVGLDKIQLKKRLDVASSEKRHLEGFLDTLQQNAETNRALLNANPDLMVYLQRDGQVANCKPPRNEFPFWPEGCGGQNIREILPSEVYRQLRELMNAALMGEETQMGAFSVENRAGIRHYEVRMAASGRTHVLAIFRDITDRVLAEEAQQKLIEELREALAKIKTLKGLLPICASCKKIRDDSGYWNQLEDYFKAHADVEFSHGICEACAKKLYGEYFRKE